MDKLKLREGGGRIAKQESKGDRYFVRYMGWDPGSDAVEGSSAVYPVAAIKSSFAEAFPEGTRMRADHDGICESGGRLTKLMAYTDDTPVALDNGPEGPGMYGHIRVSNQWSEFVGEFAHTIGLSISGAAELESFNDPDHEDYDPEAPKTVKRFLSSEESPYNAIDFVEAPGADGRIVALALESAREKITHGFDFREHARFGKLVEKKSAEAVPPKATTEGKRMDEETRTAIAEAITGTLAPLVETLTPREQPPVEIRYEDVAEAAFEAGLTQGARRGVYEAVRAGKSPEDAISEQRTREDEIRKEIQEKADRERPLFGSSFGEAGKGATGTDVDIDALAGV